MERQQTDHDSTDAASRQATCCRSAGHSLTEQELATAVQRLAALGDDTRYEALRLIAEIDDGGVCVCELEPALGVSQALSRLFSTGLIERRKEGRWRYYTATPGAKRLLQVLDTTRAIDDE